jgi:hypothetical protein
MHFKRFVMGVAAALAVIVGAGQQFARSQEVDVDVLPYAVGGTIVTGGIDHATGNIVEEFQTVFDGAMENNGTSVATDEPGYDNNVTTPGDTTHHLTPNGNLHFSILPNSFSGSRVGYWDGIGSPTWSSVAPGFAVTVQSQFNPANVANFDGSGTSSLDGFDIKSMLDSQGKLHEHMDTFFPLSAPTGLYLLTFQLSSSSLNSAEPMSIVLNYGATPEAGDAAVSSVPEPASASAIGLGVISLLSARRRRAPRDQRPL